MAAASAAFREAEADSHVKTANAIVATAIAKLAQSLQLTTYHSPVLRHPTWCILCN